MASEPNASEKFQYLRHHYGPSFMVDVGEPGDIEIMPEAHGSEESRSWAHLLAGGYDCAIPAPPHLSFLFTGPVNTHS